MAFLRELDRGFEFGLGFDDAGAFFADRFGLAGLARRIASFVVFNAAVAGVWLLGRILGLTVPAHSHPTLLFVSEPMEVRTPGDVPPTNLGVQARLGDPQSITPCDLIDAISEAACVGCRSFG